MNPLPTSPDRELRYETGDGRGPPHPGVPRRARRGAPLLPQSRSAAGPGRGFGHDVLLALIMALAMAATVLLYR